MMKCVCLVMPPNASQDQLEPQMKNVYASLLLHMDDSNEEIKNAALETLRITGRSCPNLLLNLTHEAMEKHVHKKQCQDLVSHLQGLKV